MWCDRNEFQEFLFSMFEGNKTGPAEKEKKQPTSRKNEYIPPTPKFDLARNFLAKLVSDPSYNGDPNEAPPKRIRELMKNDAEYKSVDISDSTIRRAQGRKP